MALIDNTAIAEDCRWCGANEEPHSPACPLGERYAQVQALGGVPIAPLTGQALLDWFTR